MKIQAAVFNAMMTNVTNGTYSCGLSSRIGNIGHHVTRIHAQRQRGNL